MPPARWALAVHKSELAAGVPRFLPACSWCRSSLSNCSITTVQDGNASGSWFGRALARKISAKRVSAAAASLESLAAATMKSPHGPSAACLRERHRTACGLARAGEPLAHRRVRYHPPAAVEARRARYRDGVARPPRLCRCLPRRHADPPHRRGTDACRTIDGGAAIAPITRPENLQHPPQRTDPAAKQTPR
jgi:hypothetical protein